MKLDEYYNNPAIDQSKLKKLIGNAPWNFTQEIQQTPEMLAGNIFDCLLTRPSDFDDEYYVCPTDSIPSDIIKQITDTYMDKFPDEQYKFENRQELVAIARDFNYQSRWKDETVYDYVTKVAGFYYDMMKMSRGKQLVDIKMYDSILSVITNLRSIEQFSWILKNDGIKYQMALFGKYNGIDIKGLIDALYIDEGMKTINIVDIKSTSDNTANFITSVKKFRYDIQMSFYEELVAQNYVSLINDGYEIKCWFLVENLSHPGQPVLYYVDDEILSIGKYGLYVNKSNFTIGGHLCKHDTEMIQTKEGWVELIEKFKYYSKHGFETSKFINENANVLRLEW